MNLFHNPDNYSEQIKRALITLYGYQEEEEQSSQMTRYKNDIGFNAFDALSLSPLAKKVISGYELSSYELDKAAKSLQKYRNQLSSAGIDLPKYVEPTILTPNSITKTSDNLLELSFPYSKRLVDSVKTIPGTRYNPESKTWKLTRIDNNSLNILKKVAQENNFVYSVEARNIIDNYKQEEFKPAIIKPTKVVDYINGLFVISFPFSYETLGKVKEIYGAKYNGISKTWSVQIDIEKKFEAFKKFVMTSGFSLTSNAQDEYNKLDKSYSGQKTTKAELSVLSKSASSDLEIPGLGGKLRPFQKAGVEYVLKAKRAFIADEMGLGKTVQALAALEADKAFPALVVCPATLKYNWEREATKWLPKRSISVIGKEENFNSDVTIINYDLLKKYQEELKSKHFIAIIFDESQYCKNYKAQRTQLATELAKGCRLRLALTGTPILNRPQELLSQLQILDRINDMGGFWEFAKRYCGAIKTRYGWDFSGSANTEELHKKLRETCYIRRDKKEVLPELPEKTRVKIPMEIDNKTEYKNAEKDLISFLQKKAIEDQEFKESLKGKTDEEQKQLKKQREDQTAYKASRAEQLVKIETTKQMAAKGKLNSVKEWIQDFLETGQKLVVFGTHKDIVNDISTSFNAPKITGDTSIEDRQKAVDNFQNDPKTNLIVANIQAGGTGLTLTASSNVAFIEQGWNPGTHDQAEDRVHRIGQKDAVTAYYFLGKDTIDENINDLIEEKRDVVSSVTDGKSSGDVSIIKELSESIQRKKNNPLRKKENKEEDTTFYKLIFGGICLLTFILVLKHIGAKNGQS